MLIDLKAQAEALVISANDIDGLLTCALRPSNVFGPGDTRLVPFLVNLAIHGFAKVCKSFLQYLYFILIILTEYLLGILVYM